MKKYLAFAKVVIKEQLKNLVDGFGTIFSFSIHILIFSVLWDFVLDGKTMAGYTRAELIWYVIIAEAIIYSFHNYYRKIAYKVEMGDFAYDMTKPYNFMLRIISEGLAELPMTLIIAVDGIILGIICTGIINISLVGALATALIIVLATILLLLVNMIVGLSSIWLGKDVSSLWLLVQKAMLIFAFSPIELFPESLRPILLLLPTTHVIYTPASLFVHFSISKFLFSIVCEILSIAVMSSILAIMYKKGVRKQNVNGI